MFLGHPAVGLASKRLAPRTSLGVLIAAPMMLDLLWPIFLLLGVEHVRIAPGVTRFNPLDFTDYPWSHSLLMSIVWGIVFGFGYWVVTRYGRGAVVVGLLVVSHWVLDLVVHRPDLPLWPGGGPKFGLGLWNSPIVTIGIESAMFAIGILIYRDVTRPRDRTGSINLWLFVMVFALMFIVASAGAAPPNATVLGWIGISAWLFPLWAWWFDRHREAAV
jgi:hypothetical protein